MVRIISTTFTTILAISSCTADNHMLSQSKAASHFVKQIHEPANFKTFVSMYHADHGRITLDVTCALDISEISNIEEVQNSADQVFDDAELDCEDSDCTDAVIDYALYSADYKDVCESNGGKIYTNGIKSSCSNDGEFATLEVSNVPICVGLSCTDDEIDEYFEVIVEDMLDGLYDDDQVECETTATSSCSAVRITFAIFTAILFTGLILF
mmetsp:Transcript_10902/g.16311  ORF Transcript_10902/g.16311 Transcript_10902/m.16311 type:complete len:211 (+) Transcript_10902:39-671(+)|eukprot:CAMPEP_0196801418 /NCGR_PEP_ID=MMETSP1362-20130617/1161_1 /TAXON_ID=163516 /ORGANISM="Leptocylindrus danicus, Strain CCMP1856" /LENGTH=210 /DNA_ID=CAMNT_0042172359 /DNA_START=28 /DNA_END=660 /DNA_ORIENTATION=+